MSKHEVRINASPAAFSRGKILAAQRSLAAKIRAIEDRAGTIDIDRFDPEAGAHAPLQIEGFSGRGDHAWQIYVSYPHADSVSEEANFIDELSGEIVDAVKELTRAMKDDSYYLSSTAHHASKDITWVD